jgi:uncharacterized protein involved in exopolysaccharide biosynthesis/Mrp family chromosome partitioning ATPase
MPSSYEFHPDRDPAARPGAMGAPFAAAIGMLRRNRLLIALAIVLGIGGGYAVIDTLPPNYTAETTILVQSRRTAVSDLQAIGGEPGGPGEMRTQIDLLRSPALARQVVEDLGLADHPDFVGAAGMPAQVLGAIRRAVGLSPAGGAAPSPEQRTDLAAAQLLDRISVRNELRSNVLRLGVTTGSAALSAQIANRYAERFLDLSRRQKYAAARRAQDWLEGRLRELATDVREAEARVAQFRAENGLADVASDRRGLTPRTPSVAAQQLAEVGRQVVVAAAERSRLEAQMEQVQAALASGDGRGALAEVLSSPIIQRLREAEALARGREAEIASRAGPRNPDLIAARAQTAQARRQVEIEIANALGGIENQLAAARVQEASLRASVAALRDTVSAEQRAEQQLAQLHAEADAQRTIFESFLGRATQLANLSGIQEPDAEIVSPAVTPVSPSGPLKTRWLALVGLASLVAGVGLAVLRERLRTGVGGPAELEAATGFDTLGVVPAIPVRGGALQSGARDWRDADAALTRVRASLAAFGDGLRPQVVAVTSAVPDEDKSAVAAALAKGASEAGLRVLLVDCDLHRPAIAGLFGLAREPGLADQLAARQIAGAETPIRQVSDTLDILPTGRAAQGPAGLLATPLFAQMLEDWRRHYDLVVLDTPPVLAVPDLLGFARHCDSVLLATAWQRTPRPVAAAAARLLRNAPGLRAYGVLTRVNLGEFATDRTSPLAYVQRRHPHYAVLPGRADAA